MVVLLGIFKVLSGFELFNWLRKEDLNMTLKNNQNKNNPYITIHTLKQGIGSHLSM